MKQINTLKLKVKQLIGKAPKVSAQLDREHSFYGSSYGGWAVVDGMLNSNSVVYSFGVGEDISFDLSLIEKFGCIVHAFDPTPKVALWLSAQQLPPQFVYHQYALSDQDGTIRLYAPKNPDHISHSINPTNGSASQFIDVPSRTLASICIELGHTTVDLLKMDIEGFEYGVIADLSTFPIRQLLIEFHHTMYGIAVSKTEEAIRALNSAGFAIFNISERGQEFGFIAEKDNVVQW